MLRSSFPWLAGRVYPRPEAGKLTAVALGLALAAGLGGCGGGSGKKAPRPAAWKRVSGPGFTFEASARWRVERARGRVWAVPRGDGVALLSVQTFRLLKPYRPELFARTARELDDSTRDLARKLHGRLGGSRTVRVAGGRARQYDLAVGRRVTRMTFVLRGRNEYLLTCRFAAGERNPLAGACARLLASFRLTRPPA